MIESASGEHKNIKKQLEEIACMSDESYKRQLECSYIYIAMLMVSKAAVQASSESRT